MKTISIPPQTRALRIDPASVNAEDNTVDVCWSTGAVVRRYSWAEDSDVDEELVLEGAVIDEMNTRGVPFLNSHQRWSIDDVFGRTVPGTARIDGALREGRVTVKFSRRGRAQEVLQDMRDGVLPEISIGYLILRIEKVKREGMIPLYRVTSWKPFEVSTVPIGADSGAGVRAAEAAATSVTLEEESTMPEAAKPDTKTQDEIRAAATAEERTRVKDIRSAAEKLRISGAEVDSLIDDGTPIEQARAKLIDLAAERAPQAALKAEVQLTREQTETDATGMVNAMLYRAFPDRVKLDDNGERFMHSSLLDMARDSLEARGTKTRGMPKSKIALSALHMRSERELEQRRDGSFVHTTTDFSNLLLDVMHKSMRLGYQESSSQWRPWCKQGRAEDFREINTIQMSEISDFEEVGENGEYKRGTLTDSKESYRVVKRGKIFEVSFELIVNDNLGQILKIPMGFGQAAQRLEADIVWAILTSNPQMGDGYALFHANHGPNLATGADELDPDLDGIQWARRVLGRQKGPGGKARLNLKPKYILVPIELELKAMQVLATIVAAESAKAVPEQYRQHIVIGEQRLSESSTKAWYAVADPNQIDTIEYAYLAGYEGVSTDQKVSFNSDGLAVKGRHIFGAKALDHRGFAKNPNT